MTGKTGKPKRERVAPDTNVIASALKKENTSRDSRKALTKMKTRDRIVYLSSVDRELRGVTSERVTKKRFLVFSKKIGGKISHAESRPEDLEKYIGVKGKDRRILDEARKTKVDRIVTMDKKFSKNDGRYGVRITSPKEYLSKFKKQNNK